MSYDTQHEKGNQFQDLVCDVLADNFGIYIQNYTSKKYQYDKGENRQGMEIKYDSRCTDTGRLSIETAEKKYADNLDWIPSGIHRQDNSWLYIQGNCNIIYIFPKRWLLYWETKHDPIYHEEFGTFRGFFLPGDEAKKLAIKIIHL